MFIFVIESDNTVYQVASAPSEDIHPILGYWVNIGDFRPVPEPGWKYINGELIPVDLTPLKNTLKKFIQEKWLVEIKRTATAEQQYQYEKAIADVNAARTAKQLTEIKYDYTLSAKNRPMAPPTTGPSQTIVPNGEMLPPQELR